MWQEYHKGFAVTALPVPQGICAAGGSGCSASPAPEGRIRFVYRRHLVARVHRVADIQARIEHEAVQSGRITVRAIDPPRRQSRPVLCAPATRTGPLPSRRLVVLARGPCDVQSDQPELGLAAPLLGDVV